MRILLALVLGVIGYFVAQLVFNQPVSALIGVVVGVAVYFGDRRIN